MLVANKVDVVTLAQLEATKPDEAAALRSLASEAGVSLIAMSNVTDEGVNEVKTAACDLLLQARVDSRLASPRKVEAVANRLTVAVPKIAAGAPARGVCIPASVLAARAEKARVAALASSSSGALDDDGMTVEDLEGGTAASAAAVGYAPTNKAGKGSAAAAGARKTQREMMWEGGGPGVYSPDYSNEFDLADESWNHDVMPEIMDGKNVADFIDADVLAKLDALEAEHDQIEGELAAAGADAADEGLALDADEVGTILTTKYRFRTRTSKSNESNSSDAP